MGRGGRLVKTTGDGLLATFDGPGRGIRCAVAFRDQLHGIGLQLRAGLHTGEVELRDGDARPISEALPTWAVTVQLLNSG